MHNFSNRYIKQLVSAALLFAASSSILVAYAGEAARVVFVSGKSEVAGVAAVLDAVVQEGNEITTGADGYVYLKTIDHGFLILRPNTKARIVTYHVDSKEPVNTRIKLELLNGVARSISGDAVKLARQNFRFNTPVAAIGVRGTDFTVFTNQDTSRVTVLTGGVIVTGFGGSCAPQGTGPCEGSAGQELFARQQGQLLQISKGQVKPLLLNSNGAAPDVISPPRIDEPAAKIGANVSAGATAPNAIAGDVNLDPQKALALTQALTPPKPPTPPAPTVPPIISPPAVDPLKDSVIWGRYASILGRAPTINVKQQQDAQAVSVANSEIFILFQAKGSEWRVPTSGSMSFSLNNSEAFIKNESQGVYTAANIENAKLQLDFANAKFSTAFDLISSDKERFALQSQGGISSDGRLDGNNQFSYPTNMAVSGVVTAEKGGTAAYYFQSRLDKDHLASGITYWGK